MHNFQDSNILCRTHNFQDLNILRWTHNFQDSNILRQTRANFSVRNFFKVRIFSRTSFNNKIEQGAMVVMIVAGQGAMPWIGLLK
jgi:hypothetical protein